MEEMVVARQLTKFQVSPGSRVGVASALVKAVLATVTDEDMLELFDVQKRGASSLRGNS